MEIALTLPLRRTSERAIVSAEDFPSLALMAWRLNCNGYVVTGHSEFMHRAVMPPAAGMVVDHINGNKLDNRRENLRICTRAQNNANQKPQEGAVSPYKGVTWFANPRLRSGGYWKAYIAGKHLGYFKSEIEAARAYDKSAKDKYGAFARLNFPVGVVSPLDALYDRRTPTS